MTSRWKFLWQRQTANTTRLRTDGRAPSAAQSSSEKTARLVTAAVTSTNSRPVAVHRRKRAGTQTNEGGSRGGASAWRGGTDVSIHQRALRTPQPRRLHILPPFIWLLMAPVRLVMDLFVSASSGPFRWGPHTNMSTYQTSLPNFSTAGK